MWCKPTVNTYINYLLNMSSQPEMVTLILRQLESQELNDQPNRPLEINLTIDMQVIDAIYFILWLQISSHLPRSYVFYIYEINTIQIFLSKALMSLTNMTMTMKKKTSRRRRNFKISLSSQRNALVAIKDVGRSSHQQR